MASCIRAATATGQRLIKGAAARRPSRCTPLSPPRPSCPRWKDRAHPVGPADRCLVAANLASFDSPAPEWKRRSWRARDWLLCQTNRIGRTAISA